MGMLKDSIIHWGRQQSQALNVQGEALDRNFWISGASKFARYITQIVILGWGAYLALEGELTGGMMIAASIIACPTPCATPPCTWPCRMSGLIGWPPSSIEV